MKKEEGTAVEAGEEKVKGLVGKGGRLYYQIVVNGETLRGSFDLKDNYKNRIVAGERLRELKKAARSGEYKPSIQPTSFEVAVNRYESYLDAVAGKEIGEATVKRYKSSLQSVKAFMELQSRKLLHSIHKPLVEEYKQWRYDEWNIEAVTLRHDLLAWSRFFNWAVDRSYVLVNPFPSEKIKIPSGKDAVCQYVLTPDELKCYFGGSSGSRNLLDQGTLINDTGMRPSEVRNLTVSAFDPEERVVRVLGGKSAAAKRTLALVGEGFDVLVRRAQEAQRIGTPWLFPDPKNRYEPIGPLNKEHDSVCEKLGLCFRIYDLRHTFATRLAKDGMNPFKLAYVLGHADTSVLRRYVHIGEADALKWMFENIDKRKQFAERTEQLFLTAVA